MFNATNGLGSALKRGEKLSTAFSTNEVISGIIIIPQPIIISVRKFKTNFLQDTQPLEIITAHFLT